MKKLGDLKLSQLRGGLRIYSHNKSTEGTFVHVGHDWRIKWDNGNESFIILDDEFAMWESVVNLEFVMRDGRVELAQHWWSGYDHWTIEHPLTVPFEKYWDNKQYYDNLRQLQRNLENDTKNRFSDTDAP